MIRQLFRRDAFTPGVPTLEGIREWFDSPLGNQILAEQKAVLDQLLPEYFGYHLLQLSVQHEPLCNESPINHKISMALTGDDDASFRGAATELPFENDSMDVVILHHLFDFYDARQNMLREAARVTIPMGRVLIVGFNPVSLWGLAKPFAKFRTSVPWGGSFVRAGRLMDWLNLLDFKIDRVHYNTYGPPIDREPFVGRQPDYSQGLSRRSNLPFGATYVISARKHVGGVRPIRPEWRPSRALGNLTVVPSPGRATGRNVPRNRQE